MENLGIGCNVSAEKLQQVLKEIFPDLNFHYWEMQKEEVLPDEAILYSMVSNTSEFPIKLSLYRFPDKDVSEREQYIARQVSLKLTCRTIIPYQIETNTTYPYACIIFDKGKSYLADDLHTLWADEEGGEVKVIEPTQLEEKFFDSQGNIT